jgi:hypothetical protein
MPRKLTTGEKRLLILLAVVLLAFAYYYLFWEKISAQINQTTTELTALTARSNTYKETIAKIPELQSQIDSMLSQESYDGKFYPGDTVQETYMNYLHQLLLDNELTLKSIVFSKDELQVAAPTPVPGNPSLATPGGTAAAATPAAMPKFLITTAVMSFTVDFIRPSGILNMLDTIERSEQMTIVNNFTITAEVKSATAAGENARPGNAPSGGATPALPTPEDKEYKCIATIKFVSLYEEPQPEPEVPVEEAPEANP